VENLDPSTMEVVERMFQALFDDLSSEKSQEQAGWRSCNEFGISPVTQTGLLRAEISEKNLRDEVRLNFRDYRIRRQLRKTFEVQVAQLEYLLEIQRDNITVRKAQKVLGQISAVVQQSSESWANLIALGWWKMLETSGMPALINDVLSEGFSPENWTVKAVRSCPQLALGVAQRWGKVSQFNDAIAFLEKTEIYIADPIALPPLPSQEDVNKVEKILKWTEVEEKLTECSVKALAFSWFAFLVLEHANLLPYSTEYSVRLFDNIWSDLQKLLEKNQQDILRELESLLGTLTEKGIAWAPDILRFPEVIS